MKNNNIIKLLMVGISCATLSLVGQEKYLSYMNSDDSRVTTVSQPKIDYLQSLPIEIKLRITVLMIGDQDPEENGDSIRSLLCTNKAWQQCISSDMFTVILLSRFNTVLRTTDVYSSSLLRTHYAICLLHQYIALMDNDSRNVWKMNFSEQPLYVISALIQAGLFVCPTSDSIVMGAFYDAIAQGNLKKVIYFIKLGCSADAMSVERKYTPLSLAIAYDYSEIVAYMLQNGANPNKANKVRTFQCIGPMMADCSKLTPLCLAVMKDNRIILNQLIQHGALVNAYVGGGKTPLHLAIICGNSEIAQQLIFSGADVNAADFKGNRPIHGAIKIVHRAKRIELVEILNHAGADINALNTAGASILLIVIDKTTNDRLVKILLDIEADPNIAMKSNGNTPLHIAAYKNKIKIVELLLRYNANHLATNQEGLTPLQMLEGRSRNLQAKGQEIVRLLKNHAYKHEQMQNNVISEEDKDLYPSIKRTSEWYS